MRIDTLRWLRRSRRLMRAIVGRDTQYAAEVELPYALLGDPGAMWAISPTGLNSNSVVYSFGIGDNISFERSLIEKMNVRVHAFDPTPRSAEWLRTQSLPNEIKCYGIGIASFDGDALFYPPANDRFVSYSTFKRPGSDAVKAPVRRLKTIMQMLGHDRIDVCKMDIEGSEYDVLADIVREDISIDQFLIEFHHRKPGVGASYTRRAVGALKERGYSIYYVSDDGAEFSFASAGVRAGSSPEDSNRWRHAAT